MSTCPPCNQKCNQGRDCPANKQGHAEAMKRALTALETIERFLDPLAKWQVRRPKDGGPIITIYPQKVAEEAINDLRQAVAKTEKQKPVAHVYRIEENGRPCVAWDDASEIKVGAKLYAATRKGLAMTTNEQFITQVELATRWKISEATLERDRSFKKGVRYIKLGGLIRYRLQDVIDYENACTHEPEEKNGG